MFKFISFFAAILLTACGGVGNLDTYDKVPRCAPLKLPSKDVSSTADEFTIPPIERLSSKDIINDPFPNFVMSTPSDFNK